MGCNLAQGHRCYSPDNKALCLTRDSAVLPSSRLLITC